jgi:hypothetical protein
VIVLARIAHKADRTQAQLRLDRRVLPPVFTIASPRSGEGEAMAKAGGSGGVLAEKPERNQGAARVAISPRCRPDVSPRAQAALGKRDPADRATPIAKKIRDWGCPEQRYAIDG